MKLRGKELYIIAAIVVVVLCAAWYFFFFNPIRSELSDLDEQLTTKESELVSTQADIQRLQALKKTSPQAEADMVRLRKLLPAETAMPSFIIELTQTAKAAGLRWESVAPAEVSLGTPFSLQPIDLEFSGGYFDLEDFLYRLENAASYRNGRFVVSGRMFAVSSMDVSLEDAEGGSSDVTVSMTVHGFMWTPEGTVPGVVQAQE
jgi:Tfp pilus assembly protein PilO